MPPGGARRGRLDPSAKQKRRPVWAAIFSAFCCSGSCVTPRLDQADAALRSVARRRWRLPRDQGMSICSFWLSSRTFSIQRRFSIFLVLFSCRPFPGHLFSRFRVEDNLAELSGSLTASTLIFRKRQGRKCGGDGPCFLGANRPTPRLLGSNGAASAKDVPDFPSRSAKRGNLARFPDWHQSRIAEMSRP